MSGKGQLGFAEAFVSPGLGLNRKLDRLDELIDWSPLERLASAVRPGDRGRPPYAPLSMLKALYLQALYDLSDPGLEEALLDRLSFRRFCGFALDGGTPDETTICRFRGDARAALEAAFEKIDRQLDAAGLLVRKGTLMDATLVSAASRPPGRSAGAGARHPKEPDAGWTKQNGKAFFGYKAHIGVGQGSGIIRRVALTSAKTHESEVADQPIRGDEDAVYGDRAYEHKGRRARHQGPHHAPAAQAHTPAAPLAAAPQRSDRAAAHTGRGRVLRPQAALRAAPRQEPDPGREHGPPLRRRRRLQHAPGLSARRTIRAKRARKPQTAPQSHP